MKKLIFVLCVGLLACNQSTDFNESTIEGLASLPAEALKEPYESNPDLVKVIIPLSSGEKEQGDFLLGKKTGTWTVFHNNGLVKSTTSYVDGIKQGMYTELDNRGQLQIIANYHRGELHGDWKQYNRDKVKEERNYENGKLEGIVRIYYNTGTIMEEGSYVNGVRDGISRWYDNQGNLSIEYVYKAGELVNK